MTVTRLRHHRNLAEMFYDALQQHGSANKGQHGYRTNTFTATLDGIGGTLPGYPCFCHVPGAHGFMLKLPV